METLKHGRYASFLKFKTFKYPPETLWKAAVGNLPHHQKLMKPRPSRASQMGESNHEITPSISSLSQKKYQSASKMQLKGISL